MKTETTLIARSQVTRRSRAPLYLFFTANIISSIGDVLTFLAVPWFVLQTTGSITQTGITAFFSTAAIAFSAFFGSALVDRLGFKRASVVSDLMGAVSVALIPLLYFLGALAFWELLALVFLAGLFTTPGATARAALVPELAELAQMPLERVSAATDGITRVSRFIGAPLAGLLIVIIGASNLLWIDALSFAVSALLIALSIPRTLHSKSAAGADATAIAAAALSGDTATELRGMRRYLAGLAVGLRFIWRDRLILSIVATVLVTNLLDAGFSAVLAPAYIRQTFGNAVVLGGIVAAFGGAAFLGTLVFGAIGHRLPRQLTLGIGFTLAGLPRFLALVFVPSVPLLLAIFAFAGFCIGPVNPLLDTVQYERVPMQMRARVFGAVTAGAMIGTPLGGLLSGVLVGLIGIRTAILLFGAVYFLATASLLINPAMRSMEKNPTISQLMEE
ncbi:MAG: hypothetical protein OJF49_004794 [Ktedonobacterales bacterium]|jgi:MFS family permease|nr:MAG: hypothetical protein OJF49_004794 [Ktedonobacterales bacterium]